MNSSVLYALSTLAGTIIGVGLFVLPYITSRVGLDVILIYFLVLGFIAIIVHLLYAEIVMRTEGKHRLTGYAEIYLGKTGKIFALISMILGLGGALFSYLTVGGNFLFSLASPLLGGPSLIYVLFFLACGAFLIYAGIKGISKIEFIGLILFFIILFIIFVKGLPFIKIDNLFTATPINTRPLFLPYGAILFSLWGASLIPEITELMKNRLHILKKLIPAAIIITAFAYLFFILLITGMSGALTSKDAITGLKTIFGNGVINLGFVFGILTTFTSFITIGLTLEKVLWYDLKIPRLLSFALVCFGPLILYLSGFADFLKIIGLAGGVMIGIEGILIILMYLKAKAKSSQMPAWSLRLPKSFITCLIIFFVLGMIYEIIYFIK